MFSWNDMLKSPRIVPAGALRPVVGPVMVRTASTAPTPSRAIATTGQTIMLSFTRWKNSLPDKWA